jgi:hypothetical protein
MSTTAAATATTATAATATAAPGYWDRMKGAGKYMASIGSGLDATAQSFTMKTIAESILTKIALGLITLAYIITCVTYSFDFETPYNISSKAQKAIQPLLSYGDKEGERRSLDETIAALVSANAPANQLYLTNFYIRTANVTGMLPSGNRTVASIDAIRFALLAGARAFVFDLWPDTEPGEAQHGPVLLTMEPGSMWRRTSYNSMPFATALSQLVYIAFQANYKSTSNDPIVIYLRFRTPQGKAPRADTMEMTARALQATIQPYRLDSSFNRSRAQGTIPMLPISVFKKKVIVASNVNGAGTSLVDYINLSPQGTSIPVEYSKDYAKSIIPSGATAPTDMKTKAIAAIQQNLSFVAPYGEDPAAYSNEWDAKGAETLGIHCIALNMDPSKPLKLTSVSKVDSFVLKPLELRYSPTILPSPQSVPDMGFGSGPAAGSITVAAARV